MKILILNIYKSYIYSLIKVLMRSVLCCMRQRENYYTKTAVHLSKLLKGHSQYMLGCYKASPIVELIVMSKNSSSFQIACLYNIHTVT